MSALNLSCSMPRLRGSIRRYLILNAVYRQLQSNIKVNVGGSSRMIESRSIRSYAKLERVSG